MLGMTAGATKVYLSPDAFRREKLAGAVSRTCLLYAISIPVTLLLLCLLPLSLYKSVMSFFSLLITTIACSFPFCFAGIVIPAVLIKQDELPIARLYAADLIGASLGCLFVLGCLQFIDAPSLILMCSSTGALAGFFFPSRQKTTWLRGAAITLFPLFLVESFLNLSSTRAIRPVMVKGQKFEPAGSYHTSKWNTFFRIAVYDKKVVKPQYWGASPLALRNRIPQYSIRPGSFW